MEAPPPTAWLDLRALLAAESAPYMVAGVAVLAAAYARRGARPVDRVDLGLWAAVAVASGAPLLVAPFLDDAAIQRMLHARAEPFGDWNHPPLGYLVNLPARWSSEPALVRFMPFLEQVALVVATGWLAATRGGPRAGAWAAVWLAAEASRRHTILSVADWDLAGLGLVGALVALGLPGASAARRYALAGLGTAMAVASSWMAWPAACLVGLAAVIEILRTRGPVSWALAVPAAVPLLAIPGLANVVHMGRVVREMVGIDRVGMSTPWALLRDLPTGRAPMMGVVLALGLLWMARERTVAAWVALAGTLGTVAAFAVAREVSFVNGAYYVQVVLPWALAWGAVGWTAAARALPPTTPPAARWGLLAAAFAFTGARIVPFDTGQYDLVARVDAAAAAVHTDTRPVRMPMGIEWQLALRQERAAGVGLRAGVDALRARAIAQDCLPCLADPACRGRAQDAWWIVWKTGRSAEEVACFDAVAAACAIVPDTTTQVGLFSLLDCRPDTPLPAPPPADEAAGG